MSRQSRFHARYWMLGAGALRRPRGMVWGGRREEGSGWGTHVYLWWIHVDIWQNQYNIVKLNNKIKFKKRVLSKKKNSIYKKRYNLSQFVIDSSFLKLTGSSLDPSLYLPKKKKSWFILFSNIYSFLFPHLSALGFEFFIK